jgi:hypothetical protein
MSLVHNPRWHGRKERKQTESGRLHGGIERRVGADRERETTWRDRKEGWSRQREGDSMEG